MRSLRSVLRSLVALTMLVQAAIVVTAAREVLLDGVSQVLACLCSHDADHGQCPMHHPESAKNRCRVRGTDQAPGMTLLTLLAPFGVSHAVAAAIEPPPSSLVASLVLSRTLDPSFSPDAPPPRG